MKKRTLGTQKTQAGRTTSANKIKRTSSKSKLSATGLSVKEELEILNTSISIARGMLATLLLGHKSDFTKKLKRTEPEHLRILLQDVMEEIWNAQEAVDRILLDKRPRLTV